MLLGGGGNLDILYDFDGLRWGVKGRATTRMNETESLI